jgi:hypothetical protein
MLKYNDYPIEECVRAAERLIADGARVHQKWTCRHCHARQTMSTPNTFFRSGVCEACDSVSLIGKCNYMVIRRGFPNGI